jgi:hypothetical protein
MRIMVLMNALYWSGYETDLLFICKVALDESFLFIADLLDL